MYIGELARRTGVSTRSLRYYEEKGLLRPARLTNGYRTYDADAIGRVRHIRQMLSSGLGVDDIRLLVSCLGRPPRDGEKCPDIVRLYEAKLAEIDAGIAELRALRAEVEIRLAELATRRERR
ncbi:MAG: MerR family transcriptional regulator [Streptosporangiales bacterium]|nr:MerR family transcriptional regulator [Streptosporangiales bacterium]